MKSLLIWLCGMFISLTAFYFIFGGIEKVDILIAGVALGSAVLLIPKKEDKR